MVNKFDLYIEFPKELMIKTIKLDPIDGELDQEEVLNNTTTHNDNFDFFYFWYKTVHG